MDGRIVNKTEEIMREKFSLNNTFTPESCNIKKDGTVVMEMVSEDEGVALKATFPRGMIERAIELADGKIFVNPNVALDEEEDEYATETEEDETSEPTPSPRRKPVRKGRKDE